MAHRGWCDFRCQKFYFLEEHDALGGLERVGTMLDKARYSTSLSSKLTPFTEDKPHRPYPLYPV